MRIKTICEVRKFTGFSIDLIDVRQVMHCTDRKRECIPVDET